MLPDSLLPHKHFKLQHPWKGLSTASGSVINALPRGCRLQEDVAAVSRTSVSAPWTAASTRGHTWLWEECWLVFLKCFFGISSLREIWNTWFNFLFNYTLNFKKLLQSFLLKYRELGILFWGGTCTSSEGICILLRDTMHRVKCGFHQTEPQFFHTGFRYVSNISNCLF